MRLLARLWILLGASLVVGQCAVVLVSRRLELNFTGVALTSLLPGLQSVMLTWLSRSASAGHERALWRELASRWSVRWVWVAVLLTAVASWTMVHHGTFLVSRPRQLVLLVAGTMLAATALRFMWTGRMSRQRGGRIGAALLLIVLGSLAAACWLVGLGGQLPLVPPMALITALGWTVAGVATAVALVWAASRLGPLQAVAFDAAAVVALMIASAVPVLLWLRPYHGADAWLDPARGGLLIASALLLSGALAGDGQPAAPAENRLTVGGAMSWLVLWVTLLATALAGALVLAAVLRSAWVTPPLWWLQLMLVPAIQTAVLLAWKQLSAPTLSR